MRRGEIPFQHIALREQDRTARNQLTPSNHPASRPLPLTPAEPEGLLWIRIRKRGRSAGVGRRPHGERDRARIEPPNATKRASASSRGPSAVLNTLSRACCSTRHVPLASTGRKRVGSMHAPGVCIFAAFRDARVGFRGCPAAACTGAHRSCSFCTAAGCRDFDHASTARCACPICADCARRWSRTSSPAARAARPG